MRVHDDPRHGRVVIRVIGFIASEPEASLFQRYLFCSVSASKSRTSPPVPAELGVRFEDDEVFGMGMAI